MTRCAVRPLDYASLSEGERAAVETLFYGELSQYERHTLLCNARELKRLIRLGWVESSPGHVESVRYDRNFYHPAYYWITEEGADAMVQAEQQARITFWLKQERTAKILCFPLRVEYTARGERDDGTHAHSG